MFYVYWKDKEKNVYKTRDGSDTKSMRKAAKFRAPEGSAAFAEALQPLNRLIRLTNHHAEQFDYYQTEHPDY